MLFALKGRAAFRASQRHRGDGVRSHMFHLAFSTGGEHASAFHSIARAQSRGFEPCWPSIEDEVEPSSAIEHILVATA
jgi:hypothetical protein